MKDALTLPNILTYIRIALVPIFVVMFFTLPIYYSFSVFVLASLTDVVDGFLARRYNQTSKFGKVLDPFADKLLKISVLICFVYIGVIGLWYLLAMLVIDLALMIAASLLFKREIVIKSNFIGKAGTAIISLGILLSFFHAYLNSLHLWVLYFGLAVVFASAISYLIIYLKIKKG